MCCAKTTEPIEMPFGVDSRWPKEPLLDGVEIAHEIGNFEGCPALPIEKHWKSLLRCMQQKG